MCHVNIDSFRPSLICRRINRIVGTNVSIEKCAYSTSVEKYTYTTSVEKYAYTT